MAAIKALEQWCKMQCDGYRDVAITNMTTSFRSGLAFCALIHKYRPDLIDYDSLKKEDVFENNRLAFQVAEEKLGIPALLDAEDMVALRIPDRLSILTYVSQYYNYFKGRPPMGGVKRPAEGSKEEPSEKKNQPVVAKILESKSGIENRLPSTITACKSPMSDKVGAQRVVLADGANKTGTLNSKCVACRSHVHLVQRHFVEGKLYHRACFKCCECSSVLHTGSYKPGKDPGTFVCNTHQNSHKTCTLNAEVKTGFSNSAVSSNCAAKTLLAPPTVSSVLSAPINVGPKSSSPVQHSQTWTASAQKTQTARQKFFQTVQVTQPSTVNGKPIASSGDPNVHLSSSDANRVGQVIGKKLGGENSNNNNKNLFTIRSAESRFCTDPFLKDFVGLRKNKSSQDPAGNWEGRVGTSQTNNEESPCLKTINKDNTRPTAVHKTAKGPIYQEWQAKLKSVNTEQGLKACEPEAVTNQPSPCRTPRTSFNLSISATTPPPAQTAAVTAVGFGLSEPMFIKEANPLKPVLGSKSLGLKHGSCSPVKFPLRPPAVSPVPINSTAALDCLENPSAAKKGKYLSPTAAFRTEMRSPSRLCRHIPVEQIEKELVDIELNLVQLEKEGVELEKQLRNYEEEGEGDILMDPLMVDWFNLIRKKQMYIRKESELVYLARTQELEQQQPGVEEELRRLLEKPDNLKSKEELHREKKLLQQLMEIVDCRNTIVQVLDEDRLREVEEDNQLNKMMQDLGVKKTRSKRKSFSRMFKRRSKRPVK
ncbi:PREDICTED: MICAL-like protein 2 [Cyprinodon variegatus]|uniref:Mical-like 2a n=1 Tax=Cyprinodon variegatus TaxID=28743 RepID=A0A3Q2CB76_CYPVA|nr:PREDICTED: MICAL-like protein 2 [Cyprinodon variegatus]